MSEMSELRRQLRSMRDEYRDARYPGDLAAEILSPPRKLPVAGIVAAAVALTAIAAAVLIYVGTMRIDTNRSHEVAQAVPAIEFLAMPEFPSDLPLLPAAPAESLSEIGGMPEFPEVDWNFSIESEPQPSEELS